MRYWKLSKGSTEHKLLLLYFTDLMAEHPDDAIHVNEKIQYDYIAEAVEWLEEEFEDI